MSYSIGGAFRLYRAGVPDLGGAAFVPTDISGLKLWFKADQITGLVDADPISTWSDQGSLAKDLTSTSTARPLYKTNILNSLPVARFDGVNDSMNTASFTAIAQPLTIFAVVQSNNSGKDRYWDAQTGGRVLFGNDTTGYEMYAGSTVLTGGTRNTSWHAFACIFNGASSKARRDGGAAIVSGNPGSGSLSTLWLASDGLTSNDNLSGDIAEFLAYDTSLSLADLDSVGNYLATKYALTWTAAS